MLVANERRQSGPVVQLVRTLACHARGRGFEPHPGRHFFASVAQLVERRTENPYVVGSIPTGGTNTNTKRQDTILPFTLQFYIRCHSQAVRPRSAKPLSPVRIWVAPPKNKGLLRKSFIFIQSEGLVCNRR